MSGISWDSWQVLVQLVYDSGLALVLLTSDFRRHAPLLSKTSITLWRSSATSTKTTRITGLSRTWWGGNGYSKQGAARTLVLLAFGLGR